MNTVSAEAAKTSRRLSVLLPLLVGLTACDATSSSPTPDSLTLTPAVATLEVGTTVLLSATLKDVAGNVLPGRSVTWTSRAALVATVATNGLVSALAPGVATITATAEGKVATATITVTPHPVASVTISPQDVTIEIGASHPLIAVARDRAGQPLVGRAFVWTTSAAQVASVSAVGVATGVSAGVATVTASSEGQSAVVAVTVPPTGVVTAAYQSRFGVHVPRPAIVPSGFAVSPMPPANHTWTSVAYIGATRYQLKLYPDGSIDALSSVVRRPQGTTRIVVVASDHGNTNIGSVLNSGWRAQQDAINQQHAAFAQQLGLAGPIVTFVNANVLAPAGAISEPGSRASVAAFLSSRGIGPSDYDVIVSLNLDATRPEGGFAGADFVYMGCYFCTGGSPLTLTSTDLAGLANAIYHHEVGHLWGWNHEWTNCTFLSGPQSACRGFMTAPTLFGWTDTDGDGIPEILDPTPYGR